MDLPQIEDYEQTYGPLLYGLKPINFTHGKGAYLYTDSNQEYIDFIAGHGVANIGHSHPKLVAKIQEQASKLIVLHSSFPSEERAILFKKISELTPAPLTNMFLSNSGTESVEAAIKLAITAHRKVKKPKIIAMKRSFHGRTLGALGLTFGPNYRNAFQGAIGLDVAFASFGNIESVRQEVDENTIAIITEIVQGEGGIYPAPPEFPRELRELADEKNLTLIFDEVQSGVGRTGKFFAFEHYNTVPDIVTCAKAIAGGVPMGVTLASKTVFENMKRGEHASTFGGNPLACAAANATLDIITEENLLQKGTEIGNIFSKRVGEWLEGPLKDIIREHRGLGAMQGIQLKSKAGPALNEAFNQKLLLLNAGMSVIRALPPLVTGTETLNHAFDILEPIIQAQG